MTGNLARAVVYRALTNAIENGYHDFIASNLEDVANDLRDCDADCETMSLKEISVYVASWKKEHL